MITRLAFLLAGVACLAAFLKSCTHLAGSDCFWRIFFGLNRPTKKDTSAQSLRLLKELPAKIEDPEQNLSSRLRWLLDRMWQEWKQIEDHHSYLGPRPSRQTNFSSPYSSVPYCSVSQLRLCSTNSTLRS
jgi:hypothetical protein